MTAVLSVTAVRVRDGKFQETLGHLADLKKIIENAGARFRVVNQMFGPAPGTVTVVVETAGWAEFGALAAKLDADAGYQGFIAAALANPWGDLIARSVSTEVAI